MSQENKLSEEDALTAHKLLEKCINQLQIALYLKEDEGSDQSRDRKLWFVCTSIIQLEGLSPGIRKMVNP